MSRVYKITHCVDSANGIAFGGGGGGGGGGGFWSKAKESAKESGLPGPRNGKQDAYRHCVAAGELARISTESTAVSLGDAYESYAGGPSREVEMDKFNNRVGAKIGADSSSFSEVESGCKKALNDGNLSVIGRENVVFGNGKVNVLN